MDEEKLCCVTLELPHQGNAFTHASFEVLVRIASIKNEPNCSKLNDRNSMENMIGSRWDSSKTRKNA